MGVRGPAPTPTPILEMRGSKLATYGRDGEPQLPVKAPTCPSWLRKEAKAEWRRQVKHLAAMRVMAEPDRAMLAAYCEAWADFVRLCAAVEERLKEKGSLPEDHWRLILLKDKAAERMARFAQQFGFTPAARTRLRAAEQEEPKSNGKSRFFAHAN